MRPRQKQDEKTLFCHKGTFGTCVTRVSKKGTFFYEIEPHNRAICTHQGTFGTKSTIIANAEGTLIGTFDKPHRMRFRHRLPHLTVRSYGAPLRIEGKSIRGGVTSHLFSSILCTLNHDILLFHQCDIFNFKGSF